MNNMNLTEYSDRELSIIINNDECLYNMRFTLTKDNLKDLGFTFTSSQWDEFKDDLADELEEV